MTELTANAAVVPPLFERLLAMSREAHAQAHYEVAYHALTAAMHSADDAADVRALAVIGREAERQIAHIDRVDPAHRLSTTSAARHAHPGVYALLVRQAATHIHMHETRDVPGTSWRISEKAPPAQ